MDLSIFDPFISSMNLFFTQLALFLPKLIFAYILWLVGKWLIGLGVKLIDLTNIKALKVDDTLRNGVRSGFIVTAKVILVLVILDTLGIGSTVVGSLLNGLVYTIAITLGLSFGKALEPEARSVVDSLKKHL